MSFWRKYIEEEKEIKEIAKKPKINFNTDKIVADPDKKTNQDFNLMLEDLAKTSDFKRLIYRVLVGKFHRGTKENLDIKLSNYLNKFRGGLK